MQESGGGEGRQRKEGRKGGGEGGVIGNHWGEGEEGKRKRFVPSGGNPEQKGMGSKRARADGQAPHAKVELGGALCFVRGFFFAFQNLKTIDGHGYAHGYARSRGKRNCLRPVAEYVIPEYLMSYKTVMDCFSCQGSYATIIKNLWAKVVSIPHLY